MNLRKLLCGLLALSLLLSMVPMAFMEEEQVGDSVVEIGDYADAEDAIPVVDTGDDLPDVVKNIDLKMNIGQTRVLTFEYPVDFTDPVSFDKLIDEDDLEWALTGANEITLTAKKALSTVMTINLYQPGTLNTFSAIVNLTVKNNTKPKNIYLNSLEGFDADGKALLLDVTGKTLSKDLTDTSMQLVADVRTEAGNTATYRKIVWESSRSSVVKIEKTDDDYGNTATLKFKKAGKATITATVKGTAIKAKVTIKVSNDHKAKKVTISASSKYYYADGSYDELYRTLKDGTHALPVSWYDSDGKRVQVVLNLYAEVDPGDYTYDVTWSVNDKRYAYFKKDNKPTGSAVTSVTTKSGNTGSPVYLYINKNNSVDKVTVTAKTASGAKKTLDITLFDINKVTNFDIYRGSTKITDKKIEADLTTYKAERTDWADLDFKTQQKNTITVKAEAWNYVGGSASVASNKVSWTSSNKKVATIAKRSGDGMTAVITLKKKGTTTIKCTIKSNTGVKRTKSFKLTVTDKYEPKAIYFVDEDDIAISELTMKKGDKVSVNVMAEYLSGEDYIISYSQLKYSSSRKHIATVSDKGIIEGVAKGTTYIKVTTYNNLSKKLKVIVK